MFYERPQKRLPRSRIGAWFYRRFAGRFEDAGDGYDDDSRRESVARWFIRGRERRLEDEGYALGDPPRRFSFGSWFAGRRARGPAPEDQRPPRGKSRHWVLRAAALLVALALLSAGLLYVLPAGMLGFHDETRYLANNDLPSGFVHVLLMGIDRDKAGTSRTDTMMVLSVGRGRVFLTSLQRDTGVTIPGRSGSHRLNAAYAYGGAELALQTVNQNFGLNITRYALVDYESFPELIDLIGGVTVTVTDDEARQINNNMREVLVRAYKTGVQTYDSALGRYQSEYMETGGENLNLSGMQALGYARIRNLDSDYGRTNRQRKVLSAALQRLKTLLKRPVRLIRFAARALGMVKTNMNALEVLSLGEKAILAQSIDQMRLPVNGTYTDDGGMFYNVNYAANRNAFLEFVYGTD